MDRGDPAEVIRNAPEYTEQEVTAAASLTSKDGGISYTNPEGCEVAVVLTSPDEIDLYASAGDTVVTNSSGTAGVKLVNASPECQDAIAKSLRALDD